MLQRCVFLFPRSFRTCGLAGALAVALSSATGAQAIPLPPAGAYIDSEAEVPDTFSSDDDSGPIAASASTDLGEASHAASATVDGPAQSHGRISSASGVNGDYAGSGEASWTGHFAATGTDPSSAIDVDLLITIDGILDYGNDGSGAGLDDLYALVDFYVELDAMDSGTTSVFTGTAHRSLRVGFVAYAWIGEADERRRAPRRDGEGRAISLERSRVQRSWSQD